MRTQRGGAFCSLYFSNSLTAKLVNWHFHSFQSVSQLGDPQLAVSESYPDFTEQG